VGPRPADASWAYNAQTLGQLRADTPHPRWPIGCSAKIVAPSTRPSAGPVTEPKMHSSNFCLKNRLMQLSSFAPKSHRFCPGFLALLGKLHLRYTELSPTRFKDFWRD
jgi:hypothetical protein